MVITGGRVNTRSEPFGWRFAILVAALLFLALVTLATPKVYQIVFLDEQLKNERLGESKITRVEPLWVSPTSEELGYPKRLRFYITSEVRRSGP